MKPRDGLLAATILGGAMATLIVVDLVATPAAREWLAAGGRALLDSDAVRFLLICTAFLSLLSLVVAAYDTAAKRRAEWEAEQRRKRAIREERVREALTADLDSTSNSGRPAA